MIINKKIIIKLINFPLNIKTEYIELNESEFYQLIKKNIVIIDKVKIKVKHKMVNTNNELEIEFDKIL